MCLCVHKCVCTRVCVQICYTATARALGSAEARRHPAKDCEALTTAGTRDRREEFSVLLTRLVRKLEGEKARQKLPGKVPTPGAQHRDNPQLGSAVSTEEERPVSSPVSAVRMLQAHSSPRL